jgi:hypothetical protein
MVALRLVRLIENHSDKIAQDLLAKLRSSSRTRQLQRIRDSELTANTQTLLAHLSEWLLTKTQSDIAMRYRTSGARLMRQEVPLGDVCWAIIITKEFLWDFLQRQGFLRSPVELYGEMELLCLLNHFFDHALCYVTEGYEQERQEFRLRERTSG